MASILDILNKEQLQAVETVDGPVMVFAGAGTGKTKTLTARIAYMIQEKNIKPYNILATCLGFAELLCLTAWDYFYNTQLIIFSVIFAILCIAIMLSAKKGVEKWTL